MKKVCVLLSTYNGEKYLQQQLDSLYLQKDVELIIVARDDGSTDSTIEILKNNAIEHPNFTWYTGENVRPARSFLNLVEKTAGAECDYYAFCDQDDVWDDDKLKCAVVMLESLNNDEPNMYFSNLRIVDQDLNFYRYSHCSPTDRQLDNKYSCLIDMMATGCTIVFNKTCANLITDHIPATCSMHDTWLYIVCTFFGTVVYDFEAHIAYRQHGNNVVGAYLEKNFMKTGRKQLKRLFNRNLQPRYDNAVSFYTEFGDLLNDKDKEKILEIVNYKKSLRDRIKLFRDKEIRGVSRKRDLFYRALILFGNI